MAKTTTVTVRLIDIPEAARLLACLIEAFENAVEQPDGVLVSWAHIKNVSEAIEACRRSEAEEEIAP